MNKVDILLELIKLSGLNQKDFAKKTGLKEPMISEWKKKKRNIKISTLKNIAEKIGYEIIESYDIKKIT